MTTPRADHQDFHTRLARALGPGYELRERLGFGGFAEVYAALDTQLKRDVAVKVLRPELAGAVVRERFRREAEAVARVRHPHFGLGTVLSVEQLDDDIKLLVRFNTVGQKTLRAKYAKLEMVS